MYKIQSIVKLYPYFIYPIVEVIIGYDTDYDHNIMSEYRVSAFAHRHLLSYLSGYDTATTTYVQLNRAIIFRTHTVKLLELSNYHLW